MAALCSHGAFCVIRRISRFQFLAIMPAVLAGQSTLPTTQAELAAADRPTWAAALAAACDTIPVDSTWRAYLVPNSETSIRLPRVLGERGKILSDWWNDALPAMPSGDYTLAPLDSLTGRLLMAHATSVFQCHPLERVGSKPLWRISVLGFDDRPVEDPQEGIWYVIGTWYTHDEWLMAMSRDLWGARAFVTGMRGTDFPRRPVTPP